jgi:hypothetical protein
MNSLYKIIAYIAVSLFLGYLAYAGNGCFFDEFLKSIIPLLATLLAINITTSALIIGELSKLKDNHSDADLTISNKAIKRTFITEIVLILALLLVLLIRDILLTLNISIKDYVVLLSNAFVFGVFLYYLEIIYDLGKALLGIVNFNNK